MNGFLKIVLIPYSGMMHINIKKLPVDTHNMDESQNNYSEWKKLIQRVHSVWFHVF